MQCLNKILGLTGPDRLPDVVLAPMSGITDRPFRAAVRRAGGGLMVCEMVASHAMLGNVRGEMRKLTSRAADEQPIVLQLAGWDLEIMAEAAKMAEQLGVCMIDINMGCPAKKITGRLSGAALMRTPELAGEICQAVVNAVNLPVSLKMRLGWDDAHHNAPEIAKIAEASGIQLLTIHGRTREQMYKGQALWSKIRDVVDCVSIAVLANGDIKSPDDAVMALKQSGADGIMVGRGAQGRPWLLAQIADKLENRPIRCAPDMDTRYELMRVHLEDILHDFGHMGLRLARKHMSAYCDELPDCEGLREIALRSESAGAVFTAMDQYFRPVIKQVA